MTLTASQYLLRQMSVADIPRVSEIERESFPTMWPQTAYKRELQRNSLAAYLVICQRAQPDAVTAEPESDSRPSLRQQVRRLFQRGTVSRGDARRDSEPILGFVGLWFMVDEAHVVTIAVAEAHRRRGLGEMLLIAAIELAQRRDQEVVTLECRISNTAAQALYEKYGFRAVGVRKRYYSDNDEDAMIMTTFPIRTSEYRAEFERLRAEQAARRGAPFNAHPDLWAAREPLSGA